MSLTLIQEWLDKLPMRIRFFNIVNVIILFPFTNLLVKLIQMIIPDGKMKKKALRVILINAFWLLLQLVLENTMYEFAAMAQETIQSFDNAVGAARNRDKSLLKGA